MRGILKGNSKKQSLGEIRSQINGTREDKGKVIEQVIEEKINKIQKRKEWARLILQNVLILAAVYIVFTYIFGIAVVRHNSMYPNVKDGDVIVYLRLGEVTTGDIVVLKATKEDNYLKRVIAEAGDEVDINDTGILHVNGVEVKEEYVFTSTFPKNQELTFPLKLEKNELFVLGDNRAVSKDSREFGTIAKKDVKGKVILILRFGQ